MESIESYSHKAAKSVLAGWFRDAAEKAGRDNYATACGITWRVNRSGPHWGVWEEYPILEKDHQVWDERDVPNHQDKPPAFEELKAAGTPPKIILDVALQSKGDITYGFEIVHRNKPSFDKMFFIEHQCNFRVLFIRAHWILCHTKPPKEINNCSWRLENFHQWGKFKK